jgi:predicted dinucleotide-binding enzyme
VNLVKTINIGLIGAGNVGSALAKILVEAGHNVKVANSKGPRTLRLFELETKAKAVYIEEVIENIEILIIAIPFGKCGELRKLIDCLSRNTIVVDTGNYNPMQDGSITAIDQGMTESAWISQQVGISVIKAFNNIIASSLASNGKNTRDSNRIALPVSGDDPQACFKIALLVEELGFDAFNAGTISESWRQQPGQPAYATDPNIKELPFLLQRADRVKAIAARDKAMNVMSKIPLNFPVEDLVRASRFSVGLDAWNPKSWMAMLRLGYAMVRTP